MGLSLICLRYGICFNGFNLYNGLILNEFLCRHRVGSLNFHLRDILISKQGTILLTMSLKSFTFVFLWSKTWNSNIVYCLQSAAASNRNIYGDQTGEPVQLSGSVLAYSALALFLFTIFYNVLFLTVIQPSIDGR